jgi:adenine deaminase
MAVIFQKDNPYTTPQTFHLKKDDLLENLDEKIVSGNIIDIENKNCFPGRLYIYGQKIVRIERCQVSETQYILPGFIDAHVHIESSMLLPSEFAREAVKHGVVATVSDPHEIANVAGVDGVEYMIDNAATVGFKFFFGVPSCVPATSFDSSGDVLDESSVAQLLQRDDIYFLAEMMNFPGVIAGDPVVMSKIAAAKKSGKPVDGHAPALRGDDLRKYIREGITTDHECEEIDEAEEKIGLGMKIIIREGSAAKNFDKLFPLIDRHPSMVMVCTDDCCAYDLQQGTFLQLLKRGLDKKLNLFNLLRAFSWNPVEHYNLPVGRLRSGDFADFIIVDNLQNFNVLQTYINGKKEFDHHESFVEKQDTIQIINKFYASEITADQLRIKAMSECIRVIGVTDKSLHTKSLILPAKISQNKNGEKLMISDVENDILKIVVLNRYQQNSTPSMGFVQGFGLKHGAFCTSVSHDSHNIVAVGTDDDSLVKTINMIVKNKGGIACCDGTATFVMPLPIAGLMSIETVNTVAAQYELLLQKAKMLGCVLSEPFMTMSFLTLLVIPELKIFDKGLFDVTHFQPINLYK